MINKITTTLMVILFVALMLVSIMWKYTANSLHITKDQLCTAQETISTLQADNQNLIQYITQKDNAIKELEQKYTKALENIPEDKCGNTKPSKELLEYFKKAYRQ